MKVKKTQPVMSVREIVSRVVESIRKSQSISAEELQQAWHEAAGSSGTLHARPTAIRKRTLWVRVDSAAWVHALTLNKRRMLKTLKRKLGKDKIAEIRFRIGELESLS